MPLRNLIALFVAAVVSLMCYCEARSSRYTSVIASAMWNISRYYIEPTRPRELMEAAMDGLTSQLDEHSGYIREFPLKQLREELDQEFSGIGIVVDVDEQERLFVFSPLYGTPAFVAGLRAGDLILEIDGKPTSGFAIKDALNLIRGKKGSTVQLTVQHAGEEKTHLVTVRRDTIEVETVLGGHRNADGSWNFSLKDRPEIGYVRITSFGEKTPYELKSALQDLQQRRVSPLQGLILDLRGNPGGLLEAAVAICDFFVRDGDIVSLRDRYGNIRRPRYPASERGTIFDSTNVPIAVLVDQYSASASEIVSACLQDHQIAGVVGERTWGKGTVQDVIPLEGDRSALRLTTATYWRPSQKNIHRSSNATEEDDWGVRPDPGYEIALSDEQYRQLIELQREQYVIRSESANDQHTAGVQHTDVDSGATSDQGTADSTGNADAPATSGSNQGFQDIQLQKAIDYLEDEGLVGRRSLKTA